MPWPTSGDYREAVQHLDRRAADEELRAGRPSGPPGRPAVWSGGFADVYRIECPTVNTWALKCFTSPAAGRYERYREITAKLKQADLPFMVDFEYLERGILVRDEWFPVVKMRWVEGQRLDRFVADSLDKRGNLRQLLEIWPRLAEKLREAGIAHADLQHGNVLLVPTAEGKLARKLVDYDGMWVPQLAGTPSGELGHPAYQHPQRLREGTYSGEVDRFSHLVIYCAVGCLLAGGRQLWEEFHGGDDKLLFAQDDFANPRESAVFRALWKHRDRNLRALVGRLVLACDRRLEDVPWLDSLVTGTGRVHALTRNEEGKAAALLTPPVAVPVGQWPSAPGAETGRVRKTHPGAAPEQRDGAFHVPYAPKKSEPRAALSNRIASAIVVFNVLAILTMVVLTSLRGGMSFVHVRDFLIAIVLALLGGRAALLVLAPRPTGERREGFSNDKNRG